MKFEEQEAEQLPVEEESLQPTVTLTPVEEPQPEPDPESEQSDSEVTQEPPVRRSARERKGQ